MKVMFAALLLVLLCRAPLRIDAQTADWLEYHGAATGLSVKGMERVSSKISGDDGMAFPPFQSTQGWESLSGLGAKGGPAPIRMSDQPVARQIGQEG